MADNTSSPAENRLLEIHRMLFPERYPQEVQPDHVYWETAEAEVEEPWQWDSETIEWVAEMLESALKNDPRANLNS